MTVFASWPLALSPRDRAADLDVEHEQRLRSLPGHLGLGIPLGQGELRLPAQVARLVADVLLRGTGGWSARAVRDLVVEVPLDPVGSGRCRPLGDPAIGTPARRRVVRLGRRAVVRRDRRPPDEPRLRVAAEPGDESPRLGRHHAGGVAAGEGLDLAVHVLRQVEVRVRAAVEQAPGGPRMVGAGQPLGPSRRFVEQRRLAGGADRLFAVPVEVLADQRRLVTRFLEHGRDRALVAEGREPVRLLVAVDVVVVGVLAGEEAGPRRAAQRVRREGVLERQPTIGEQPLHVRHPAHVVPAHVVGLDHQHVRPLLLRLLHRRLLGGDQRLARLGLVLRVIGVGLVDPARDQSHRGSGGQQRVAPPTHAATLRRWSGPLGPRAGSRVSKVD